MRRTPPIVCVLVLSGLLVVTGSIASARSEPGPEVRAIRTSPTASHPATPRAATSVVVGQTTFTGLGACVGAGPFGAVTSASGGGASYTVPSAGVITSWSTVGGGAAGTSRPLLFVNGAVANHKTLVGKGDFMPVPVTFGVVHTFAARISVQAGWQLGVGVSVSGQACVINAGIVGDVIGTQQNFNADTSTDLTMSNTPAYRPNVAAVLESDADGDGFGDVTQDACPESALTQAACPAPDTAVTKKPKKKSAKRKAKIKFTSSVPGSTFTCAVDKKTAKPCKSPYKKKFKYGKHKVVITAVSPAGIVDATPVTVKFRVTRPQR